MKKTIIFFCMLLSIFMGLSIDLYLPSMTQVQNYFSSTASSIQWTLSVFIFGYAFVQLIYGSLSDVFGRRKPLLIGLSIYLVGNIGCLLSSSANMLILFRLVESSGAASAIVSAYAIARDSFSDIECTKVLAWIAVAMSLSPIFFSIAGGYIAFYFGWHYVFGFSAIIVAAILLATYWKLPETHVAAIKEKQFVVSYKAVIEQKRFWFYSICGSLIFINLFCFISAIPFIATNELGLNFHAFGYLLGANSFFLVLGSLFVNFAIEKLNINKIIIVGSLITIAAAFITLVILNSGYLSLSVALVFIAMYVIAIGLGMIMPAAQMGLLEPFPHDAGKANALANLIRFLPASIFAHLVANYGNQLSTLLVITIICSALNVVMVYLSIKYHD